MSVDEPPGREPAACPRCGTPYAPGQEYCLECGLRLPETGSVVASLAGAWQRRLGYYPGDWIWPALVGLVVAGLATAVAIVVTQGGKQPTTLVATQPPFAGSVSTESSTSSTTSTTPTTSTTTKPPPNRPISWPAGRT